MASFKYPEKRIQNTYAWIIDIANSSVTIAITPVKGRIPNIKPTIEDPINPKIKLPKIIIKRWPANLMVIKILYLYLFIFFLLYIYF